MTLISLQQGAAGIIKRRTAGAASLVRNRPIIKDNTVMSAEGTLLRGGTMALDEPGSQASLYATDLARWQEFRSFKFNIVRLPFSVSLVNVTLGQQLADMDKVVENAGKTGIYVMFLIDGPYGIANYPENLDVWPTVCARYKDNTNVFFEMGNEWHWDASEYTPTELDSIAQIYNVMHSAAPNSLIGLLTPASVSTSAGVINAINGLKSRGVVFGPEGRAFVAFHAYGNYSKLAIQDLKNAAPCMLTETTWGPGGGVDDEAFKINEMETMPGGPISWQVLNVRFGDLSNEDGLFSHTLEALTDRILPDIENIYEITWDADPIAAVQRALPAGASFIRQVTFSPGIFRTTAAGAIAGRVYAANATFAKGNAIGTIVDVPVVKSITFNPANPGSLSESVADSGAQWTTTFVLQNVTTVTWAIIQANGTQRGANNIIPVNGSFTINPVFLATGEFIRVWETGNTAVNRDSGAVTLVTTSRSIVIDPMNPGTVPEGTTIQTSITTTGISNITYVVAESNWSWQNQVATADMNVAGQTRVVPATYARNGQRFAVFDTNDFNFNVATNPVTIDNGNPDPGTGFFEGFDNNTTGQLGHIWGNRDQLSINNGVVRLQGLPGLEPWTNACGVMMFPGGPSAGFGHALYEMRIRMADRIGDSSGPAALIWPADDVWPGGEEDIGEISRDGVFYMAHHWRDANGDDRFEIFPYEPHTPMEWHVYAVDLYRDYLEFFVNGVSIGSTTNNVMPVFADGGVNRVPGIMNRSSNTWIECDWVRITPHGPIKS